MNIQNFEYIGRIFAERNLQNESRLDKAASVTGTYICFDNENEYCLEIEGSKYKIEEKFNSDLLNINLVTDKLNELKKDLSQIIKFTEDNGIESKFLELSIYDQQDLSGHKFYTFLFGTNIKDIECYRLEIQKNISQDVNNNNNRGLIVPCENFYELSYVSCEVEFTNANKINELNASKLHVFVGVYSPSPVKCQNENMFIQYAKRFMWKVLLNINGGRRPILNNHKNLHVNTKYLIGVAIPIIRPVGLNNFLKDKENISDVYKGGALFIFGEKLSLEINVSEFVLNLKTKYLDKAMMRSAIPTYEHTINSKSRAASIFSHETKQLFGALRSRWILKPDILFDISYAEVSNSKKLGHIEVWRSNIFEDIHIVPNINFIETMRKLAFLWTGQYNPNDIPFKLDESEEENGLKISQLILHCWDFSKNVMSLSILLALPLETVDSIDDVRELYKKSMRLYGSIKFSYSDSWNHESKIIFNNDENGFKNPMVLIRVFQAILLKKKYFFWYGQL
jgi:hypothetical protein